MLTGELDAFLPQMPFLQMLKLDKNRFTGTIPNVIFSYHYQTLDLRSNQLAGTLPASLSVELSMRELQYSNNNFRYGSWIPPFVLTLA